MIDEDFIAMVKELQKKIDDEEEKTYSKVVIEEYRHPTYFGVLEHPDLLGAVKGPCGDTMNMSLHVVDGVIHDARFWTDGCGATIASGNMVIKMSIRKTVREAQKITSKQVLQALDGLPKEHHHCALLAVNTLQKAINKYRTC